MLSNATSIETEMLYTTYGESCKDPYLTNGADFPPDLRECRRPHGHAGKHASGFGKFFQEWE